MSNLESAKASQEARRSAKDRTRSLDELAESAMKRYVLAERHRTRHEAGTSDDTDDTSAPRH
ncbi:hypothetical protein [Prauserella muralis]|uniref:Uncharacterized protein n=1 Tax=Prauserella muralis TaxID=588067 RepID=A0A2V4AHJ6_9PSEU|nr:hypothetical protein [Prauserella muralis]PXY19402.1 hypothetical protein BAY60_32180 [Prauserella muralis]TWE29376.1 hypothetical protein FHX69_2060 [Prauserella muralis]